MRLSCISRWILRGSLSAIGILLVVPVLATPAAADFPNNQRTLNLGGGMSGQTIPSAQPSWAAAPMWQSVVDAHDLFGAGWPNAVGLQETCWAQNGPLMNGNSPQDPWGYLLSRLMFVTGGGYTSYQVDENGGPNSSRPNCYWFGNAVAARADHAFSAWKTGEIYNYPTQCDGSLLPLPYVPCTDTTAPRRLLCVFPTVGIFNYTACSTHLTHKSDDVAWFQTQEMVNRLGQTAWNAHPTWQVFVMADLNINPSQVTPTGTYLVASAYNAMTEACGSRSTGATSAQRTVPTENIDYIFARLNSPYPSCNRDWIGSTDHKMITSMW